jgi:hypothetical protein
MCAIARMNHVAQPGRRTLRVLLAVAGCATLLSTLGGAPAEARSAAAPHCDIRAIKPWVNASGSAVIATNSTSCHGPVRNVRLSTRLYKFHAGWFVLASKFQTWGTVRSNRNGSLNSWGAPSPVAACNHYKTQATVVWTTPAGTPHSKVRYSSSWRSAAGPCTLP